MIYFIERFVLFIIIIVLQRSFIDILWPNVGTPVLLISLVSSLVFSLSFEKGLLWSLFAVFLYELVGSEQVSWFPVYAVFVAYVTSFLSRRLLIEHHVRGIFTLALSVASLTFFYGLLIGFLYKEALSFGPIALSAVLAFIVLPFVSVVVQWLETRIRLNQMTEFRGLRT